MIVYRELSSLEQDLGISAKTLYAVSNNLSKHYRKAKLPKKSGGFRNLSVPDEVLKSIQKQIAEVLLIHSPTSRYAKAYRFANQFLPWVEPGYVSDGAQTSMYALELHRDLGFRVCS